MLSSDVHKTFDVKKWLNKKLKPDKEFEDGDDIAFLSEIIIDFRFWQVRSPTIEISRLYPA